MSYTLIYYPGCSNCRNGLAVLQEKGVEPTLRLYMKDPLSTDELKQIAAQMGGVSPRALLREKNAKEIGLSDTASDEDVFTAMSDNPKIIQRPIGICNGKAVLGRPNEALLDIL